MGGPVVQLPDLKTQLTRIWEAIRILQTRGILGFRLTKDQILAYNDGASDVIVVGPQQDGSLAIWAPSLKTANGQRFKLFIQSSDPGPQDTDSGVIRIWIQTP